jgi:hypothetical protein
MPKKIQNTTKAHLVSVPLPNHGASYTVISHQFVMDYAYQTLATAGFSIVEEEYRCTADGQIAQGIYRLNFNNDPELSMMFAWTNSYNKMVKFKCVVGAYINQSGSVMISGDIGSWVRKHTGSADTEVKDTIDQYVSNAHMYYNQLCSDKVAMELVSLNRRKQSQLLGVLFAEYEILTTEQASMIREQMKKPQQVFANTDSLWAFYNFVTNSLQHSHPKTWMEDQRILHYFIGTICNFSAPVQQISTPVPNLSAPVDPLTNNYGEPENQTNLLVQIAEVTGDDSLLQAQYPLTPNDAFPPVQEEVENEEVLHQYEEEVEDVVEDTEVLFDIDADDDAVLDSLLVPIEKPDTHEDVYEVFEDKAEVPAYEVIHYTDAAGNTFEASVIPEPDPEDDEDIPQMPAPEPENDAFEYEINTVIEADLNDLSQEVIQTEEKVDNTDFELDFITGNSDEEEKDETPDFF